MNDSTPLFLNQKRSRLTAEREALLVATYQQTGDAKALDELVLAFLPLITGFARRNTPNDDLREAMLSTVVMAFIHAISKFDPSKRSRLSTYAYQWMSYAIKDALHREQRVVALPRSNEVQKALYYAFKTKADLDKPSVRAELAKHLKLTPAGRRILDQIHCRTLSLNTPVSGTELPIQDTLADPDDPTGKFEAADSQLYVTRVIDAALAGLKPRSQHIIRAMIMADQPASLDELAKHYGVSRTRIGQIKQDAMDHLRRSIPKELLQAL